MKKFKHHYTEGKDDTKCYMPQYKTSNQMYIIMICKHTFVVISH